MSDLLQIYKVLADESRLRILRVLLQGRYSVKELVDIMEMGQSRVSRHLKLLSDAGLARAHREGTWAYYDATGLQVDDIRQCQLDLVAGLGAGWGPAEQDEARRLACLDQRRQQTRDFHDRVASGWARMRDELFGGGAVTDRILETLGRPAAVADLGCGPGSMLIPLAGRAEKVIGVDSSDAMLAQARQAVGEQPEDLRRRIELRLGELEHLPLADGEVDAALLVMVLHHLADPPAVLHEVRRVLAPGGRLVVCELARHEEDWMREKYGDQWLGFEAEELEGFFARAGLTTVSNRRIENAPREGLVVAVAAAGAGLGDEHEEERHG